MQQVAVGAVQLHAVQPGLDRAAGGGDEVVQDRLGLLGGQRVRHRVGLLALLGVRLAVDRDGAGRDDPAAAVDRRGA